MRFSCSRAVQLFTETQNRSNFLFLSNSGRKTASHFSWNCSSEAHAGCIRCCGPYAEAGPGTACRPWP
ncbi:hypothetical protein ELI02_05050 [Rhizobium leguminosarum]|nr:hypothetical protein ELI28_03895 [Rhizobium leguminosarum]TAV77303.1 hypothetical protein ELI27_03895 [Rhizobium leguminosarum]TAV88447.1 hypothetical protein ELI22_04045 [Rhizobium leguminosarum]TAV93026.1 hypothetical protein ELI21_04030 [Rhizobium leguminosarum]TAW34103.1 hypothetical protein ELI23_04070 [Rhizobium leguminosarum]